MATVTVNSTPIGIPLGFASLAADSNYVGPMPLQVIEFQALTVAIAAKDAANETQVILTATLPPGYVYRWRSLDLQLISSVDDFADGDLGFQTMAQCLLTEDGSTKHAFGLRVMQDRGDFDNKVKAIKAHPDSVTNDFAVWMSVMEGFDPSKLILDAAAGTSLVFIRWLDTSADATPACVLSWNLSVYQYTVEQFRAGGLHTPQLII